MSLANVLEIAVAVVILLLAVTDTYKGVVLLATKRLPLLSVVRMGIWLLRVAPLKDRQARIDVALEYYEYRRRLYAVFALIGGPWMILLAFSILLKVRSALINQ